MKKNSGWDNAQVLKYAQYVNPAFVKVLGILGYGRAFVRARDVWIWDAEGRRYVDFLAAFGAANIGHNHPRLVERLKEFFDEDAVNLNHVGPARQAADLGERLAHMLPDPLEISLLSNTGAEAVEAGLKLARAATARQGLVYCEGSYHGTTLGTLSVMGERRMRDPFEPLLDACTMVPFGDASALERVLASRQCAAFILEPIQCEGGIVFPPAGYLKEAGDLCKQYGTLLVLDEVQTALGRTGAMFAFETVETTPDILVLSKSLGGAIAPIGATVTSREIFDKAYGTTDRFDLHATTFGGNAFSCVAAMEALDIIEEERLVENSAHMGARLVEGVRERLAGHPLVSDIRGQGLLVGIELGPTDSGVLNRVAPSLVEAVSKKAFGQWAALKLLEEGIICQPASQRWNVLRLEPPLTVQENEVKTVIDTISRLFDEYRSLPKLLKDVAARVTGQYKKGWKF